ncbi:MAG: 7-cyano-7-deazaguanine synthase QueC [Nitrospirae bacterium]|nr:MAG: 7-cyano-7-deazaguanine synthase QueC [Nitrospirota bacterium]
MTPENRNRAVVLASGGLDSAVTAALAKTEGWALYLLTISYGQRHGIEIDRARRLAKWLGAVEHRVHELDLRMFGGSALTDNLDVPRDRSQKERTHGIPVTYVPARNTIFLGLALAYAEVVQATRIYFGANVVDYSGYPDCRPEFIQAFAEVARLGTKMGVEGRPVDICAPLLFKTKAEIIRLGLALGVPFHLTHSCYDPDENGNPCGRCDSCRIRQEGFRAVGIPDPVPAHQTDVESSVRNSP